MRYVEVVELPAGDYREAEDRLRTVLSRNPYLVEAWLMLGKVFVSDLTDVIRIRDHGAFYGQAQWTYGASWVLVHYLLHADDGAHRDAFLRYLKLESRGAGGEAAFYDELKSEPEALERAATSYLKRLKAR